jgi:hypothetical protein
MGLRFVFAFTLEYTGESRAKTEPGYARAKGGLSTLQSAGENKHRINRSPQVLE